ncbi:hypothetical protein SLE2022_089600 [Rubroshorea leprosula]
MLLQLPVEGALEIAGFPSICEQVKWVNQQEANSFACQEPTSVLHMRRSPSPPTSASTLSSSFNGGALADTTTSTEATLPPENNAIERKEQWASELQPIGPIPSGLELVAGIYSGQRCNNGLEDWETMLSESAVFPTQDHSLLRWIAVTGDVDDPPFVLKQLLQSGNSGVTQGLDFEGNAGLGIVDQAPGFDPGPLGGNSVMGAAGNVITGMGANLGGFHGSGAVPNSDNDNGKTGTVMPSSSAAMGNNQKIQNPIFTSPANNLALPVCLPVLYNLQSQFANTLEEKPQILNPQVLMSQQQHHGSNFLMPLPQEQPLPKRHNSGSLDLSSQMPKLPFSDPGHELLLRKQQQPMGFPQGVQFLPQQKPMTVMKQKLLNPGEEELAQQQQQQHHFQLHQQQQQQALLEQLYRAAELVGTGNFSLAQGILARLNQQLSPVGKPLHRAAFYFKEALQLLLLMNNPVSSPPPRNPTPCDVIFKMGAYKVFSEVSPVIQFVNFTCNQALLEALDYATCIHIVDFDIGYGAQWASFMQELPMRSRGAPSLRITAFAFPSTHHPVELGLMRENLTHFATEIGLSFELEVINFDSLDQTLYSLPLLRSNDNEAVAVNFPLWSSSNLPSIVPSLLRIVKQLSPQIVVSLDTGLDRNDLPFPQHLVHALRSYANLLESLETVNVTSDAVSKIEQFLLQPRIESIVLGRLRSPDKMPHLKTLFASAGFSPVTFSNFTETQADCLVKRTQARGFHVEKRQASLVLCWQHQELVSASAWRC